MPTRRLILTIMLLLGCTAHAVAAEPVQFNRDIRPILADNCFACHGADSGSREADLRLDQREAAIEFGAIEPGDTEASELIARITSEDPDLLMPPPASKKTLTEEQKQLLRRWVEQGAEYQAHWSFIAPERPELPQVSRPGWVKNPIDAFVLAKLDEHGLEPAPEAEPRRLFRRLHLDITGLPPEPEQTDAFVADYGRDADHALSQWIDRLMQSPAWGEHRARYWLDAARYGDTHGLHFDNYREMWPYRDWVIRAFNANMPFDQFTVEQIAGDLLPDPSLEQLVATGFQRCNITTNEGGTIDEENLALYAADRVQTFGWVYLGLTTNCSQCHDHKFDPITTKDYYSLAAFFRNTTQQPKDGNVKDGRGPVVVVPSQEDRPRWNALPDEIAAAVAKRNARRGAARGDFDAWLAAATPDEFAGDVPAEGLLARVPLNEGTGNEVSNALGSPSTFAATGDLTWTDDGKLGPAPVITSGSTFNLGGIGDFEKEQGFSYGAWIRTANDGASAGIIARMDEQNSHRGWDMMQQGRALSVHIIDSWPDNALKVTTRGNVLKSGQWHHVFATYDGSGKPEGVKIYIDGKEQPHRTERNALASDASIRTETPLRIGQRSHGLVFENGAIQDVRIYERTLSASDVQAIAEVPILQQALAATVRSKEQDRDLFNYWLTTRDTEYPALAAAVATLEAEQEAIRSRSPVTHIQEERKDSPAMAHILMRGEYDKKGEEVPAAPPASLHPMPEGAPPNRLGLAQWVIQPDNPLTPRVTVNRFWQQVFGQGIVVTSEDFGTMGALPTHPELLDWLSVEFRESGWDVKRFFKLMLMSATYRQSAAVTSEKLEKDRDNSLLSRGPRFRMDAEMIRDYALVSSGLLSPKMYGPGVKPYQPEAIWDVVGLPGGNTRNYVQDDGEDLYRRTVYTFWKRMAAPPNLEAFNAPSREFCTVRRERTNTPLQALVTLNDPQFVEAARHLAQQGMRHSGDEQAVLDFITRRVLSRTFDNTERSIVMADKDEFLTYYHTHVDDARALIEIGESPRDESLAVSELAAWTMVCNQIMNLDEALNK
ncbi:Planctomycete cytochrome C [Maioricimonas rarisocia]|uniref:Planctomycete cytochrome C n=1 Tax=Maioricimonas rarisocia TaxID=2528026 RepID=A0A517Z3U9_9PLAN|nr:DUF1553 domain-containing protein [Maioricimonas rarisocia]QDU37169.1 Planctomycete cytochrome C [Maioricimonas rarisocia]